MDNTTATKRVQSTKPLFTRRLPDKCLVSIATHKYVSGTYTPLDNFLNSFWLSCANLLPLWIAPNMVTLIGLGFNFLAFYLITTETNGTFEGPIRPWVNVVCGLCLFAYQTLDAMDGKHARATQNSTPLGQLFDHGCDALSCPMMSLTLASCIQLGPTKLIAYSVLAGQVPFFLAQWAESKTGALQHSLLGLFGVTETQLVFVSIHVASAFLPHTFWTNTVGDLGAVGYPGILLTPNLILVFGVIIPGALMMGLNQLLTTPATGSHYVSDTSMSYRYTQG
jgi:phosphatidylglycerophosphate synthase